MIIVTENSAQEICNIVYVIIKYKIKQPKDNIHRLNYVSSPKKYLRKILSFNMDARFTWVGVVAC